MNSPQNPITPPWGECYLDHFEKHLGQHVTHETFEQNAHTPIIQVFGYDNVFGGCRAFCSFGFSNYARLVGQIAEVFMPVDDGWDDTAFLLADTLFYIIQHASKEAGVASWGKFRTDPEWVKAQKESEAAGPIVAKAVGVYVDPVAFSALK